MSSQPADSVRIASSNHLKRQIAQYSVAATVAGVSVLALTTPAIGEVVVTKKTIPIPVGSAAMPEPVGVSLANNGVNDLLFSLTQDSMDPDRALFVAADGVASAGTFNPYATAMMRGAKIGPGITFESGGALVEFSATSNGYKFCRGYWNSNPAGGFRACGNPKNKYLGVRFLLNGQTHYGWVRLTVATNSDRNGPPLTATITGYAYETVPNTAIKAGTAATASAEVQVPEEIKNQPGRSAC